MAPFDRHECGRPPWALTPTTDSRADDMWHSTRPLFTRRPYPHRYGRRYGRRYVRPLEVNGATLIASAQPRPYEAETRATRQATESEASANGPVGELRVPATAVASGIPILLGDQCTVAAAVRRAHGEAEATYGNKRTPTPTATGSDSEKTTGRNGTSIRGERTFALTGAIATFRPYGTGHNDGRRARKAYKGGPTAYSTWSCLSEEYWTKGRFTNSKVQ